MWYFEEGYNLTMIRSGRFQVKGGNIGLGCGASNRGHALRTSNIWMRSFIGVTCNLVPQKGENEKI